MPEINPTNRSTSMVCAQVIGNSTTVDIAVLMVTFNYVLSQLLVTIIQSLNLLGDSINSFNIKCLKGIKPNLKNIL